MVGLVVGVLVFAEAEGFVPVEGGGAFQVEVGDGESVLGVDEAQELGDCAQVLVAEAESFFNGGGAGTGAAPGSGLHKLLTDFYYNSTAKGDGQAETITLTGLTPGLAYRLRMFYRQWDANEANTRFTDITLNNGVASDSIRVNQDLSKEARMMVYDYVAGPAGTLNISFLEGGNNPAASWHQYRLSNEVIPEPASIALLALGALPLLRSTRPRCVLTRTQQILLLAAPLAGRVPPR